VLLVVHPVGVLGRAEEDEHDKVLGDVVEPMVPVRRHEDDRPRPDRARGTTNGDRRPPRDDVVDLILGVRTLGIGSPGRQLVEADGQVVGPDELVVERPDAARVALTSASSKASIDRSCGADRRATEASTPRLAQPGREPGRATGRKFQ
jgi:hypothetical protein